MMRVRFSSPAPLFDLSPAQDAIRDLPIPTSPTGHVLIEVRGRQVMAMMGGMGRIFDGGYAEYTSVPVSQVVPFRSDLEWATLGAVPEMLQTAYGAPDTLRSTRVHGVVCFTGMLSGQSKTSIRSNTYRGEFASPPTEATQPGPRPRGHDHYRFDNRPAVG